MLRKLRPSSAHDAIAGSRPVWLALAAAVATLALVAGAPAPARAAAGVDVSATEGAPFTGQVASIDCSFDSATITWGDGQSSAGTANAAGDQISGSHTYAEEGDYSGRVTYADDCGSHFVSFKAHVTDAALSASGNDISATAGVDSSQVVAHFTDANPGVATSDFSATVNWGDGSSSSTGAVSAPAGGGFDVTAGHTYAAAGTYTVTVSIGDAGGSTAAPTATATVAPPPPGAPEASFVRNPHPVCTHQLVSFDASSSTPGNSPIVDYAWNLGDGRGVRHTGTNPTISTIYDYSSTFVDFNGLRGSIDIRNPVDPQLIVTNAQGRHSLVAHTIDFLDAYVYTPGLFDGVDRFGGRPHIDPRCLKNRVWPVPASVSKKSALLIAGGGPTVSVYCPPGRESCLGALSVVAVVRGGRLRVPTLSHPRFRRLATSRRRRAVLLGGAAFLIRPGTTAKVRIRLTRAGRKLLRRYHSGAVLVAISWPTANGHTKTVTRKLRIKRTKSHTRG